MAMWTDNGKYYQNCEELIRRVEQDLQTYSEQNMCIALCKMLPESKVLIVLDYELGVYEKGVLDQDQIIFVNMTLKDLHTYLVQLNKKD